jgi:hypothetical protein
MAQDGDDKQAVVAYAGDDEPKPPFPLNFDPNIFDETSTAIDNEWWPLPPGKQQTWEGTALEDGELVRRKVIFTVTEQSGIWVSPLSIIFMPRTLTPMDITMEREYGWLGISRAAKLGSICPLILLSWASHHTARGLHRIRGTGTTGPRPIRQVRI